MRILLIFTIFFTSVLEATDKQHVSGHVGEDLSIHCFAQGATNSSLEPHSTFFCKGQCSKETVLVKRNESNITQRERYKIKNNNTVFSVAIMRLKTTDAGSYFCELQTNSSVISQEVILTVLEESISHVIFKSTPAPPESVLYETTVPTPALPWDSLPSTPLPTAPSLTPLPTSGSHKEPTSRLTDTTVVIIVSVSLALLVCAIIPLILCGHWRSSREGHIQNSAGGNKSREEYSEEQTDVPLVLTAVALQTDPDTEAPDTAQYASVYQALDPQALD